MRERRPDECFIEWVVEFVDEILRKDGLIRRDLPPKNSGEGSVPGEPRDSR